MNIPGRAIPADLCGDMPEPNNRLTATIGAIRRSSRPGFPLPSSSPSTPRLFYRAGFPNICSAPPQAGHEKSGPRFPPPSITTMTPDDTRHLHEFLKLAEAERLGEGDVIAGANTLAAMAISLANISRPGSGLVTRFGDTIGVGTSLMISGSLSASLVGERVLTGLGELQNNLTSHLRRRQRELGRRDETTDTFRPMPLTDARAAVVDESAMSLLYQSGAVADQQATEFWSLMLRNPARTGFQDLHDHPMVFVTDTATSRLAGQLERCHLGRPFLHVGIDGPADFARYGPQIQAVMDGRVTAGSMTENIRGNVLVTDPYGLLGEAVQTGLPAALWIGRMPWLVDGNAGPEPGEINYDESVVPLGGIERRYGAAMALAWGQRVNDRVAGPEMMEMEFEDAQAKWIGFLRGLEPQFPGITGTARRLPVSLWFGFQKIVSAMRVPTGFKWCLEQVAAFAKFIVHRMVNARAVMLMAAERIRRRHLEMAILGKLENGPLCVRELKRKFHNLAHGPCIEALRELEFAGRVVNSGGRWRLVESAYQPNSQPRHLVLET